MLIPFKLKIEVLTLKRFIFYLFSLYKKFKLGKFLIKRIVGDEIRVGILILKNLF